MGNAIISLICVAMVLVAVLTLTDSSFYSVDVISGSWKEMEERTGDVSRTEISNVDESTCDGANVEVTLKNDGQVTLAGFDEWDVVLEHYSGDGTDYNVNWLTYNSGVLGNNEWNIEGIYLDASAPTSEIYEPDFFNPGEEMKISMKLNPVVASETTNRATISTPTGITAEVMFAGPP